MNRLRDRETRDLAMEGPRTVVQADLGVQETALGGVREGRGNPENVRTGDVVSDVFSIEAHRDEDRVHDGELQDGDGAGRHCGVPYHTEGGEVRDDGLDGEATDSSVSGLVAVDVGDVLDIIGVREEDGVLENCSCLRHRADELVDHGLVEFCTGRCHTIDGGSSQDAPGSHGGIRSIFCHVCALDEGELDVLGELEELRLLLEGKLVAHRYAGHRVDAGQIAERRLFLEGDFHVFLHDLADVVVLSPRGSDRSAVRDGSIFTLHILGGGSQGVRLGAGECEGGASQSTTEAADHREKRRLICADEEKFPSIVEGISLGHTHSLSPFAICSLSDIIRGTLPLFFAASYCCSIVDFDGPGPFPPPRAPAPESSPPGMNRFAWVV